ncbi:hypothetical protein PsorP6_004830 [Peronosclerospora sorghi]|uniref:Uncharacterized protein n=1 Tax=Peronosclerospora sorghi TaxID=230839 RepID=A0ACC0VLI1_9STRA|nr:hypothetical protein PsorP6_004830 [Peronosclerospora sorghi]
MNSFESLDEPGSSSHQEILFVPAGRNAYVLHKIHRHANVLLRTAYDTSFEHFSDEWSEHNNSEFHLRVRCAIRWMDKCVTNVNKVVQRDTKPHVCYDFVGLVHWHDVAWDDDAMTIEHHFGRTKSAACVYFRATWAPPSGTNVLTLVEVSSEYPQLETEVNAYYNELIPQGIEDWILLHQCGSGAALLSKCRASLSLVKCGAALFPFVSVVHTMKDHPRVFARLSICTTGLDVGVKIIVACGGHVHEDFNPSVTTHLIAQAVGSLKHRYRSQTVLDVTDFGLHLLDVTLPEATPCRPYYWANWITGVVHTPRPEAVAPTDTWLRNIKESQIQFIEG